MISLNFLQQKRSEHKCSNPSPPSAFNLLVCLNDPCVCGLMITESCSCCRWQRCIRPPQRTSSTPGGSLPCSFPQFQALISVCGAFSCLIVAIFLGEEEKTSSDLIRVQRQNGDGSLDSASPRRSIGKAAEPLKADLSGWRGEHIRPTLAAFKSWKRTRSIEKISSQYLPHPQAPLDCPFWPTQRSICRRELN